MSRVFPIEDHDHAVCIDDALETAGRLCLDRGARLTALRRRVLELVWTSHRPTGAYDILQRLSGEDGRQAAPPTVYRALDFLREHGLIHRIESRNAYIGCIHPDRTHTVEILICSRCDRAAELTDRRVFKAVLMSAAEIGFEVQQQMVEVVGLCAGCRSGSE